MKKIIVLVLALILAVLVVACDDGGASGGPEETTDGNNPVQDVGGTTGSGNQTPSDDTDPEGSQDPEGTTGSEGSENTVPELYDGTVVDETVYLAVEGAYYRSAPDEYEENVVDCVEWGAELNRVCYNSDWSIIVLNDTYYYFPTEALSLTEPEDEDREEFTAVNDTVLVVASDVVLRTAPISSDITAYVSVDEGASLRRVRYSDQWSVIAYEGLELYIEVDLHSGSQGSIDDIVVNPHTGTVSVTAAEAKLYDIYSTDPGTSIVIATVTSGQQLETFAVSSDGLWYGVKFMDPSTGISVRVYIQASDVSVSQ